MPQYQSDCVFTDDTFARWFSATTNADSQLKKVIQTNNFNRKVPTFKEISNTLFKCDNPYNNYVVPKNIVKPMGYSAHIGKKTTDHITKMLGHVPTFGVEVGSFIGGSALILGGMLSRNNGTLLCIDTWCGDINMWLMTKFHETMNKTDGNPKLYDLFMQNMIRNNLTNSVIPLRVSSVVGARMLKVLNYEIDFVYIDSAHEAGETFMELMLYHDVVKKGGVIFGDDYHGFPAVKYDVDLFCKHFGYKLTFTGDKDTWIIKKE
jgi:hypothetical protein